MGIGGERDRVNKKLFFCKESDSFERIIYEV